LDKRIKGWLGTPTKVERRNLNAKSCQDVDDDDDDATNHNLLTQFYWFARATECTECDMGFGSRSDMIIFESILTTF